jgi:hypothetical protein
MSLLSTLQGLPGVASIWLCDEASGTSLADSQGSLTATTHAGLTVGATSILTALSHSISNSTGYASTSGGYNVTGDFWLAIWLKTGTPQISRVWGTVTPASFCLFINSDHKLYFTEPGTSNFYGTSTATFDDGSVHFAVITRISGTYSWYVDGNTTPDATGSLSGTINFSSLGIGADEAGSLPFSGSIGGVAFGNGSGLTGAQAASIYTAGNAAALTAGAASFASATATSISMTSNAATGGTAPYTYQWYRSTVPGFTPGAGNILSGQTSLSLTDSASIVRDQHYYYCVVATDAVAATATSNFGFGQTGGVLSTGWLGDSVTEGYLGGGITPGGVAADILARTGELYEVTSTIQAVGGSSAQDWANDTGGILTTARAAFASANVSIIGILLGIGDIYNGRTAVQFAADMATLTGILTGDGYTLIVSHPIWWANGTPSQIADLETGFLPAINALANGTTIHLGDTLAWGWFAEHTNELQDGAHPTTPDGYTHLGQMWARAVDRVLAPGTGTTYYAF